MPTASERIGEAREKRGLVTLEIIEGPDVQTDDDGWEHYAFEASESESSTMRVPSDG